MPILALSPIAPAGNQQPPSRQPRSPHAFALTLWLDGITADDYIQWIHDPDPPNHADLELIAVTATSLGDHIRLVLLSAGEPPAATVAAHAVGFPITPEVVRVQCSSLGALELGLDRRAPTRRLAGALRIGRWCQSESSRARA